MGRQYFLTPALRRVKFHGTGRRPDSAHPGDKSSTLVDAGLSILFVPMIPEKLERHLDESLRRFRVEKC